MCFQLSILLPVPQPAFSHLPSAFRHAADGAYLLAFAIIMLNTDAHNPMADRCCCCGNLLGCALALSMRLPVPPLHAS